MMNAKRGAGCGERDHGRCPRCDPGLLDELKCKAEGINGMIEDRCQRMLKRRAASAVHEEMFGRGRVCCATARAYST